MNRGRVYEDKSASGHEMYNATLSPVTISQQQIPKISSNFCFFYLTLAKSMPQTELLIPAPQTPDASSFFSISGNGAIIYHKLKSESQRLHCYP